MPDAYRAALGAPGGTDSPSSHQTPFSPGVGSAGQDHGARGGYSQSSTMDTQRDHRESWSDQRQITYPNDRNVQTFIPATNDPEYPTEEEAEAAFLKLLKRSGVQHDWTWPQAIRVIAKDPQFRAIKDPKDRKAAFETYCRDVIVQDKERAKERMTKLRADFETMLKRHPEIMHYTRWKTARPMMEGETIFRSTSDETERRQLFEEYIVSLKKTHAERQTTMRKSAMDGLLDLLPKLQLEPYTRWSDAQEAIKTTDSFQADEKYQFLSQFDILTAFQNHMKALERAFNDAKQEEKNKRLRKERKTRDSYNSLLSELRSTDKVNAGTKWTQVMPLLEQDGRYQNMAGQGGSSPQELFWDIIEEEERALRGPRNDVLDVLEVCYHNEAPYDSISNAHGQDKRFDLTASSEFGEFLSLMKDDRRTANMSHDILKIIFDRVCVTRCLAYSLHC